MSTEHIVNRVNQGPHVEAEGNKLIKDTVIEEVVPFDPLYGIQPKDPQTAEQQRAGQTGTVKVEEDDIIDPLVLEHLSQFLKNQTLLDALKNQGLKPDKFEIFRLQVIMAFKHLGLDTRKFFPE